MSTNTASYVVLGEGIHYATPIMSSTKTSESDLIRSVLQMMQGFNTSLFQWDQNANTFRVSKVGVYVTHLSLTSLHNLLTQFVNAANCLQRVEAYVKRVELDSKFPTLTAFASSVSLWIKKLREIALKEEVKICSGNAGVTATLLGFSSSLSSLCSAAECLLQIVQGAIPRVYFDHNWPASAAEIAVHVLDYLYKKLDEVCLVQGGEEEVYQMVLHIFVGSLVPYIHSLDSWLFEGTLDDPYVELFFYANNAISIDDSEFWEKSYQLRQVQSHKLDYEFSSLTLNKKEPGQRDSSSFSASVTGKEQESKELKIFPSFIRDIAKSIVSSGKSLQLIRHGPTAFPVASNRSSGGEIDFLEGSNEGISISRQQHSISGLTLSEIFCISVAALIGHGDHISRHVLEHNQSSMIGEEDENFASFLDNTHTEKIWYKFLVGALSNRKLINSEPAHDMNVVFSGRVEECDFVSNGAKFTHRSFCPENPVITVCQTSLGMRRDAWKALNLSDHFSLPALNDEKLREAIFGGQRKLFSINEGTHYAFGFQFGRSELLRSQGEKKLLEDLFPFPTILPPFQVDDRMSELLPFQKNSTLTSRVLSWIQSTEPRTTPLPHVIVQECLVVYMTKQIDYIGGLILSKLMDDWRLMDELSVLRAIYLLGSGDLLQHFLTVLFTKLDRGETWDDDFELNTILQESICNSSDGMLLSAPDSLLLTITKNHDADDLPGTPALSATPCKNRMHNLGIDCLESLKFTYKVSWPLELIANVEAIKKYNQVMAFLLKVKRAKFVLDKARRWMWKGRGNATNSRKHHWLVEQKLLHFVDAFHQYVMDRVYHSAWRELCDGVAAAASLDEVIEVHEAYLLSIQRQCFVVPDKLWAMIASRINSILGLALDFHSVQQTLSSGVAAPAMMARCETEVDRIEKQFDECIAFLLRVLSFKLNVGHFPHLADLVTRINYNYFYMSISGNLVNATGPETVASRLGKISGARIQ